MDLTPEQERALLEENNVEMVDVSSDNNGTPAKVSQPLAASTPSGTGSLATGQPPQDQEVGDGGGLNVAIPPPNIGDQTVRENLEADIREQAKLQRESLKAVSSLMETAKKMSENLLEAEKLKIKNLEVNRVTNDNNLDANIIQQQNASGIRSHIEDETNALEVPTSVNITLDDLRKSLEFGNSSTKVIVKRDYKLTVKFNFNLWLDYLNSELSANDLLDVVDSTVKVPKDFDDEMIAKRKRLVRDIIINHLDENYHAKIVNLRDPRVILQKLREFKQFESNVTDSSVRKRLYALRLKPNEKVGDFIEKFDNIIREYENCLDAIPLTEEEKRSAFYQAVSNTVSEVRSANLIRKQVNLSTMTLDEIKIFLLQLEAEKKADNTMLEEPKAQVAQRPTHGHGGKHFRCFRCNKDGHKSAVCPLEQYNMWFCYYCQDVTNHKGSACFRGGSGGYGRGKRYANRGNFHKNNNDRQKDEDIEENKTVENNRGNYTRGRGRGRGNRGRGGRGGNFRGHNRGKISKNYVRPYTPGGGNESGGNKTQALSAGMKFIESNNSNEISFIADSGATEHIIKNKGLILSNFEKCSGEVIKSANKNKAADIEIYGRGNLYLQSNVPGSKIIKLTNVLAAQNISENLMSLRHFAEAGLGIYLDDEKLKIFDKESGLNYLEGNYEKPNWIITLSVKNNNFEVNESYEKYSCKARIVSVDEFLEQSQKDILDMDSQDSEGVQMLDENNVSPSVIGRENENQLVQNDSKEYYDLDDFEFNRKIIDLECIEDFDVVKEICNSNLLEPENASAKKLGGGMFWHIRLGHVSLTYLRKLQKLEPKLKDVKFDESIQDCEVCILAKMEKLPFNDKRNRAERPLQIIHTDTMGPIKPVSFPGGNRFIVVFVDDYSRFAKAYSVKCKSEAGNCLEKFINSSRNLIGENVKVCFIRADNAKEFIGGKFSEIMNRENIESDESNLLEIKRRKQPTRQAKLDENREQYIKARRLSSEIVDTSFAYFTSSTIEVNKIIFEDLLIDEITSNCLEEDELKYAFFAMMNKDPISFKEALETKNSKEWQKAVDEELNSMKENNVWTIVDRPTSNKDGGRANIIDSKWVFKVKTDENGKLIYKARLVIRGFKDCKEYELKETYAPVSRLPVIRSVLAIVNKYDLEVCQMDVKTAFLNGILEEDIFMEIPDGLVVDENIRKTKVCKLNRSLYGLKISPKRWNKRFSEEALKLGLENDIHEPCLFTWRKNGKMALLALYVDDMLIASNDINKLEEIKVR